MRIFILVGIFYLFLSPSLLARSWVVKPDGSGDAPTISAAIDSCSSGDIIEVDGGIYHEGNLVVDGKDISISKGSGISIIVSPSYGTMTGITFRNTAGSSLVGITLRGFDIAILLEDSSPSVWYNTVKDCSKAFYLMGNSSGNLIYSVVDSCGTGFYVEQSAGATIRNNTIVNTGSGVELYSGSVSISRNIFYNCSTAITCSGGTASIDCNDFWNNQTNLSGCSQGPGDIFEDPIFCYLTPPSPDLYYLHKDSPCWSSNNQCGVNMGAYTSIYGCEGQSVEHSTWGGIKAIYR